MKCDVFVNAPDIVYEKLALIFKSFLTHGTVSKEILCCAFLPLFKGGIKNPSKFDSYRAIAGASQLLKLFEYVILILWGSRLCTDSLQFGFKKGVGTTQCSWLVTEVANYFLERGTEVMACYLDCSKAFDKCFYDKLFIKMQNKNIPGVVIRALIYAYEEQKGWVRLSGKDSEQFSISNGTRQGSVLSPHLFSACYLDELLVKLRKLGIGCHVAGVWFGACLYADDVCLLANSRDVLQRMVKVCEDYGAEHNLVFSTDPNPNKSKTKCMLFSRKSTTIMVNPKPVTLDGKNLPWVEKADHLGHVMHQSGSMIADSVRARGSFMSKASDIRDNLYFADPRQRVQAIQLYCCDGYGSMLWDLRSNYAESYFKAWNIQVRLAWRVPQETHTYLVESYFANGQTSLRSQIYGRYHKFIQKLLNSPSKEIRFLSKILVNDRRSTIGKNIWYLNHTTDSDILNTSSSEFQKKLPVNDVPSNEQYRVRLLTPLLKVRETNKFEELNITKKQTSDLINSLCKS